MVMFVMLNINFFSKVLLTLNIYSFNMFTSQLVYIIIQTYYILKIIVMNILSFLINNNYFISLFNVRKQNPFNK